MAYQQWQQTPQGLHQLFSNDLPQAAQPAAMGLLAQQQRADAVSEADQLRQFNFDNAADPYRLSALDLGNQTSQANLPGIQARTKAQEMENDQYGAKAAELLKQYKAADLKREADGYDQAAQIILGQQDHIMANPLGAAGRVKDAFTKMGHPDWYNPKWDNLGPMELAKEMNDFGKGLAGHNAGLRKAIETAEAKGAAAMQVAKENNRSRESIAAANNETKLAVAKAVQAAKAAGPGGVKTLEALQAQLTQAAMAADDPEKAKALYDQAEFVGQEGAKLKGASAQVTTGAKPAMSPLGIESNADVSRKNPPPQVPRPMPRGAAPAAPAAPVAPPGAALTEPPVTQKGAGAAMPRITDYPPVPTGKVYVFNVKTGKVGAIPEGQLEQAMKSGYDLVH